MNFNSDPYVSPRTGHRNRLYPVTSESFEDWTTAGLCDLRWEIGLSQEESYDLEPDDVDIL